MTAVAIDPTKGTRKVFVLPHDLAPGVDRYRRAQPKIPSESKAFQELIRKGLEAFEREEREAAGEPPAVPAQPPLRVRGRKGDKG